MPVRRLAIAALLLPAAAGAAEPALTPRQQGDLAIRARAILRQHCGECHGDTPARNHLSVTDHRRLTAERPNLVRFVTPGDPGKSHLLELIEDGSMPPGGRPRPSPQEVDTLRAWIAAGAPRYPRSFDDGYVIGTMLDDLDRQNPADAASLRYLSFAHLVRDGSPPPNLTDAWDRLLKSLSAAAGRPVEPQPVDAAATVFRLDLRKTGWDARDLFQRIAKRRTEGVYQLVPFDLLLLEYPFAADVPPDVPPERLGRFLAAGQVRPVPFLRADWVADALRPGGPLAGDLHSLTELAAARDKPNPPCGPVARPFAGAQPVRGKSPPLAAWYAGDVSTDPAPFGLTAEVVDEAGEPLAAVGVGEPFRLKLSADREVSIRLLWVRADGEIVPQDVPVSNRLQRGQPRLLGARENRSFLVGGITSGAATATEYLVVLAAADDLPEPTIVRSEHSAAQACEAEGRAPIHRFLVGSTGRDAPFEAVRVVRKVVPVHVAKPWWWRLVAPRPGQAGAARPDRVDWEGAAGR